MSLSDKVGLIMLGGTTAGIGVMAHGFARGSTLEAVVGTGLAVASVVYGTWKACSKSIDYSQEVFFLEQFMQRNYDREIDEGMSSGMKRYVTLDVSGLTEKQTTKLIRGLVKDARDFDLCKLVQVAGFNHKDRRYLTVSGECHYGFQGSTKDMMTERVKRVVGKRDVKFVQEHVPMPAQVPKYQPTDLGPYGSTGAPMHGVPIHPDAARLRQEGHIR